ncbi:MAG TPA: hypothetical protein VF282_03180 [Bacillota bacterium]
MAVRRRPRPGPGSTLPALALLALVLGVAYTYYETPLFEAGFAAAGIPPAPPQHVWTADLPEGWWPASGGPITVSVGDRRIVVAKATAGGVDAAWYDRFGFATARHNLTPAPAAWMTAGQVLAAVVPGDGAGETTLQLLDLESLPGGWTWRPEGPASAIVLAGPAGGAPAAGEGGGDPGIAIAAYGAPSGPDLVPDQLVVLDLTEHGLEIRWSAAYDSLRLVQALGGPGGLAALTVDPASGRFTIDLWTWDGARAWRSEPLDAMPRLLTVGAGAGALGAGAPTAYVLHGAGVMLMGPGAGRPPESERVAALEAEPTLCWPVASGAACTLGAAAVRAGSGPAPTEQVAFIGPGFRTAVRAVDPGTVIGPWPGHGALLVSGSTLSALDVLGTRWTLELPLAPRALAAGRDGLAVTDGRRLAWLRWPPEGVP